VVCATPSCLHSRKARSAGFLLSERITAAALAPAVDPGRYRAGVEDHDLPIPRDGKLKGWKLPAGMQHRGTPDKPDACPFCGTHTEAIKGAMLGQPGIGPNVNPEPWEEIATCANCRASLKRIPGDPWRGTST
jgi:hypothetical protein